MPEERTVSTFTWLTPALRSRLSVPAMTAMTQIRQYYKTEEKVCPFILDAYLTTHHSITQSRLRARSKPSVKFFDIKNRFFSKSGAANENHNDEDDSWLDEPNIEVFPPEVFLDVSSHVDLSSQCLAASLSEEPSTNDPQHNPRSQEAHGEPSELDDDFSMYL
jgi:hypothetical protein